ncbi:efflux RND transporter periplasmic adaptor subunit [Oceanicella actignis]|uniref:RND family efflux transporter, MFP subunit n=1 Tax=Oceanicella actignis TaxID=1189325 RepID=A0A1M7SIG5_9RHOB|nr:efflux RND transporter periplasmic adaptor subunit [Oceanicella actignis]SET17835.1 RND family efflux transporter, MFP subunit [Oceanicella actignis]SHN58237.1 RND family efflux transporter, MFP subunit [Oceanicella actignis]
MTPRKANPPKTPSSDSPFATAGPRLRGACAAAMLALALSGAGARAMSQGPAPEQAPPRPVVSVIVGAEAAGRRDFVGAVVARVETDLAFPLSGVVAARPADVGDEVRTGQVLARLDPEALEADVWAARAGVIAAEQELLSAQDARDREAELVARGVESAARLEDAERQLAAARARLEQARAALAQAQDRLDKATLRAPHDGVVTQVFVEPGAAVSAGAPLLRVAAVEEREVVADLTEADLTLFAGDAPASARLAALPEVRTDLRLRRVDPVADPRTRTRRARFAMTDAPPEFRIGALAFVAPPPVKAGPPSIPAEALTRGPEGPAVWVVAPPERRAQLRPVRVGARIDGRVVILSGLSAGEEVVVKGVRSLTEGQRLGPRMPR